MLLPCDVFLDAPNEVAAPEIGLFRDTPISKSPVRPAEMPSHIPDMPGTRTAPSLA